MVLNDVFICFDKICCNNKIMIINFKFFVKWNRFGCLFKFYKFNNWMLRLWKYINYYRNDKNYCYILKNYRGYNWNKIFFLVNLFKIFL